MNQILVRFKTKKKRDPEFKVLEGIGLKLVQKQCIQLEVS
jgi:hypothetical protein